jgi:hypothetical protein
MAPSGIQTRAVPSWLAEAIQVLFGAAERGHRSVPSPASAVSANAEFVSGRGRDEPVQKGPDSGAPGDR